MSKITDEKFFPVPLILSLMLALSACGNNEWQPLFDGEDLPPNNHFLGIPDASVSVPGLPKDRLGNYTESLGYRDPLEVY